MIKNIPNLKKTGQVIFVIIALIIAFLALQAVIGAVPNESVPGGLKEAWIYLESFFASGPVLVAIAFTYSVFGYLASYWHTNYRESYDVKKLCETIAVFVGILSTAQALLPPEWLPVIAAVLIGLKFAISEFKRLNGSSAEHS